MFVGIPIGAKPNLRGGLNEKLVRVYKLSATTRHVNVTLEPRHLCAAGLIFREEMTNVGDKRGALGVLPRLKGTASKRQKKTAGDPSNAPAPAEGSSHGPQPRGVATTSRTTATPPVNATPLSAAPPPADLPRQPIIEVADNSPKGDRRGGGLPQRGATCEPVIARESLTPSLGTAGAREASSKEMVVAQPSRSGTFVIPPHLHPICEFMFDKISPNSFGALPSRARKLFPQISG